MCDSKLLVDMSISMFNFNHIILLTSMEWLLVNLKPLNICFRSWLISSWHTGFSSKVYHTLVNIKAILRIIYDLLYYDVVIKICIVPSTNATSLMSSLVEIVLEC